MENKKQSNLTPEQQEKKEIELENKILAVLLPSVGGVALVIGAIGFILTISENVGVAIFLLILAILGLGGIAYGVVQLIKKQHKKLHKEEVVPSDEPRDRSAK